ILNLRRMREPQIPRLGVRLRTPHLNTAVAPFAQRLFEFRQVASNGADDANPRHHGAMHQAAAFSGPVGGPAATSFCTPSTMSRTERIFFISSSGTLMLN